MSDVDETFVEQLLEQFRKLMAGRLPPRAREMRVDALRGVALIPIHGQIAQRADHAGRDGTSIEHISADLRRALADDRVRGIVLDIDSGGGVAAGTDELHAEIVAARAQKPIVAHSDTFVLSAAYKIASAANCILVTEKAVIGGIGAKIEFFDPASDHALVEVGSPGKHVVGRCCGRDAAARFLATGCAIPVADRAEMQRIVDDGHAKFVEAIVIGRGITPAAAKRLANGSCFGGIEAYQRWLVDGVCSREAAVEHARRLADERAPAAAGASQPHNTNHAVAAHVARRRA